MEFQIGDIVKLKKAHPCGINEWEILRVGMDFRLKCVGCGRRMESRLGHSRSNAD